MHTPKTHGTASPKGFAVAQALLARRGEREGRKSWRRVADEIGMPGSNSYLSRVALGKAKPSARLYHALGLEQPVRVVELPAGHGVGLACVKCGAVHTTKACTAKRKPRAIVRRRDGVRYGHGDGRQGDRI